MITIDNNGHIVRNETKDNQTPTDQKRKEIAERLREGCVNEVTSVVFESFEDLDPKIFTFQHPKGTVALAFLDKGVVKFNWGRHKYYISDAFNRESPVTDIWVRCCDIISVLISLDQAFEGSSLFDFGSEHSEQIKISWEEVSSWCSKCPIKYSSIPHLKI